MKEYDIYEAVNGIDPELIEAAMTPAVKKKSYTKYISIAAAAVILVISIVIHNVTGNNGMAGAPVAETTTLSADNGDTVVVPAVTTEPSGDITPENTTGKTSESTTIKPVQDSTTSALTTEKPSVTEKTTHKEEVTAVTTTRQQATDPVTTTRRTEPTTFDGVAGGGHTPPETTTSANEHAKPPSSGDAVTVIPDFGTAGYIVWLRPMIQGDFSDPEEVTDKVNFTANFIVVNGRIHERIGNSQLGKYGINKTMYTSDIRSGSSPGYVVYNEHPAELKNGIYSSNKAIENGRVYEYVTATGQTVIIVLLAQGFVCYK